MQVRLQMEALKKFRLVCIINDTGLLRALHSRSPTTIRTLCSFFLRKMAARAYCWRIEKINPRLQASLQRGLYFSILVSLHHSHAWGAHSCRCSRSCFFDICNKAFCGKKCRSYAGSILKCTSCYLNRIKDT